jgi:hypothetical protein
MDPRLKSSKKWSPFPGELCQQMVEVLTERYASEYDLEASEFVVEGYIYKEEIIGRFGLRVQGQLKQHNFELSWDYDSAKEKPFELIQNAMDVVEHLWTELLEDDLEDIDLAKTWQSLPHQKKTYHYRYSTVNTDLERAADRLLDEYEKKLVYESPEHDPYAELEDETLH